MSKLYSVKEVREFTGLSRKQLYDYEDSIKPAGRLDNGSLYDESRKGYKLYDLKGIEKLSIASLLSKLGAGPSVINHLFKDSDYDKEILIDELIEKASKTKQEMDDIITIASVFKQADERTILILTPMMRDLHKAAEYIRKALASDELGFLQNLVNEPHINNMMIFYKKIYEKPADFERVIDEKKNGETQIETVQSTGIDLHKSGYDPIKPIEIDGVKFGSGQVLDIFVNELRNRFHEAFPDTTSIGYVVNGQGYAEFTYRAAEWNMMRGF